MENRLILIIVLLGLTVGLVFGVVAGAVLSRPQITLQTDAVQLSTADQDDFIIMVAEAYYGDRALNLAQDRLSRLGDKLVSTRVERLAISYAPQHDLIARYLAALAVAMGSSSPTLHALSATATPTNTPTFTATATSTLADTPTETALPTFTPSPAVMSSQSDTAAPALTPSTLPSLEKDDGAPTLRPPTLTPMPQATVVPTNPPAPPPAVNFLPDKSRWPGTVHFYPASVTPGTSYWHLTKAIYCDAFDHSDRRNNDFGCDSMPGGPTGTSIYVMTNGNPIDVIGANGANVASNARLVGDIKSPKDICNCTYTFEASPYKISVRGAPSDAIEGFCLCSVNFGWGSHAHVRYFIYFEYIKR